MARKRNRNRDKNVKRPDDSKKFDYFTCPIGTDILWHRGFIYKECPLHLSHRTLAGCADCELRR